MYKMCVWGGVIDTLLDRLQDQFAAFMSEKGVDALIIEVCVVVARRLLCERQVGRDRGRGRETARARMDARADKRDRGRHRGWAWIDLGGEPDSVPSIRTMFKWTEITVEVSV